MDKPQIIEHIHHSVNYTLFGGRWVPASARCVLFGQHAKGTGALQVLAMEKGKLELQTEVSQLPDHVRWLNFQDDLMMVVR
jgi:hypothetical protein